jgi:hypothetical protein
MSRNSLRAWSIFDNRPPASIIRIAEVDAAINVEITLVRSEISRMRQIMPRPVFDADLEIDLVLQVADIPIDADSGVIHRQDFKPFQDGE